MDRYLHSVKPDVLAERSHLQGDAAHRIDPLRSHNTLVGMMWQPLPSNITRLHYLYLKIYLIISLFT
jgi:hypothetical protein